MNKAFVAIILLCFAGLLSGCVSSPTYGTDKTSTEQLFEDITNIASLKTRKGDDIEYKPRPDLVTPPTTASLPAPQTSVVQNEQIWPESPEETRERIVAEITENQNNPGYVSPLKTAGPNGQSLTRKQQAEAYRQARLIQKGAYQERRFLSDPPAGYKVPASTAPVGELGETEREKEKRRKEGATVKGTGKRWWQVWRR